MTVPKDFVVKMSANDTAVETAGDNKIYKFSNEIKTPSYLIALAIGDLAAKQLGPRTSVITEPDGLEKAANELDQL